MNPTALVFALLVMADSAPPARAATPATPASNECRLEVVRPDHGPAAARLVAWLDAHPEAIPGHEALRDVLAKGEQQAEVFIADIDNDGQDEFILTPVEGRVASVDLWVYKRSGDGWIRVEVPEELEEERREYYDPIHQQAMGLVRFCGKTLVVLAGGAGPDPWRQAYLWQRGKVKTLCDVAWLKEQRRFFQELFDGGLFDQAHGMLDGTAGGCLPPPDPALWRWMEADLALTAYRMGTYRTCLEHVTEAEKSTARVADPALAKALATDRRRCTTALAAGPAADDYTWLLEFKRKGSRHSQMILDSRFNGLLSAAVPDIKFKDGERFRDVFKLRLGLPGGLTYIGDRSVVLDGCMPHSCSDRAWLWVDFKRQRSIVVTTGGLGEVTPADSGFALALGSNTIPASQVPTDFWTEMNKTLSAAAGGLDSELSDFAIDQQVIYAGPGGTWQSVAVPRRREDKP